MGSRDGHHYRKARATMLTNAEAQQAPCCLCGQPIDYTLKGTHKWGPTADHITPVKLGGLDNEPDPTKLRPAHKHCQSRQGNRLSRRNTTTAKGSLPMPSASAAAPRKTGVPPRVSKVSVLEVGEVDRGLRPMPEWIPELEWSADLAAIPDIAGWPLLCSAPHEDAVGSYGVVIEQWARERLGVEFRHWQRLALRMQYQHDAEGKLVVREQAESGPRRIGKSTRLRASSLWRVAHPEYWSEQQICLLTGKDLKIAKEIHARAYHLAESWGWHVRRQNGNEELETDTGQRWIVRGQDSVYGYDLNQGCVDESWAVPPSVVDDGIEPALLERDQPQLCLTSTAHRRATSLMPGRMSLHDPDRVVLLWGADRGEDIHAPSVWRAASPHWSPDRAKMVQRTHHRAVSGELQDPDEPDPIEAFKGQYLSIWPRASDVGRWVGSALTDAAEHSWVQVPQDCVAAVEGVYEPGLGSGVAQRWAVAFAWQAGEGVAAKVERFETPEQVAHVLGRRKAWMWKPTWHQMAAAGRSNRAALMDTPRSVAATPVLREALENGLLAVDGVTDMEWAAVRTTWSASGGRAIDGRKSTGDVAGVKALSWAVLAVDLARHNSGFTLVAGA